MKKIFFLYLALISFVSFSQTIQLEKEIMIELNPKTYTPHTHVYSFQNEKNNSYDYIITSLETIKGKQTVNINRLDNDLENQKFSIETDGGYLGSYKDAKKVYFFLSEGLYGKPSINVISFDLENNELLSTKKQFPINAEQIKFLGQIGDYMFMTCISMTKLKVIGLNTKSGEFKIHEELSDKLNTKNNISDILQLYWNKKTKVATLVKYNYLNTKNWTIFGINGTSLEISYEKNVNFPSTNTNQAFNFQVKPIKDGLVLIGSAKDLIELIKIDENGNITVETLNFNDVPGYLDNINELSTSNSNVISNCLYFSEENNMYNLGFDVCVTSMENNKPFYVYNQLVLLKTDFNGEIEWSNSYKLANQTKQSMTTTIEPSTIVIDNEKRSLSKVSWNNESIIFCSNTDQNINFWNVNGDGKSQNELNIAIPPFIDQKLRLKECPISVSSSSILSISEPLLKSGSRYIIRKYSIK